MTTESAFRIAFWVLFGGVFVMRVYFIGTRLNSSRWMKTYPRACDLVPSVLNAIARELQFTDH